MFQSNISTTAFVVCVSCVLCYIIMHACVNINLYICLNACAYENVQFQLRTSLVMLMFPNLSALGLW